MVLRGQGWRPDGLIVFQYGAIFNNGNSLKSISIYQRWYNILPNTILSFKKLPKDLQNIDKLAKFRQMWSHCQEWRPQAVCVFTVHEALQELVLLPGLDADEVHASLPAVVARVEPVPLVVAEPRLVAQPRDEVVVVAETLSPDLRNS